MRQLTRTRRFAIWTSLGALSLAAVACGSDDNNSSNDTAAAATTAAGGAATTASGTATTASGTETTTGGTEAGGSGAGTPETMEQLLQRPTKITNTTPIGAEIPKGKNIRWIQCSVPACVALGKPLKEATDALGWNLKIVSHDGTPEGVKAAYEQAVREKPDGVVSSGYPRQIFDTELQQLAAANIPVIQVTVTDAPGNGLTAVVNGPPRNAEVGRQLATYVAGDSDGKAKALWATSTFPILVPELEGFEGTGGFAPTLKDQCAGCTYDKLEIPIDALATDAPARMVSYLQAHPDVNYVVGAFGDIVSGLPGALADAGLADKVKVVTYSQNATLSSYLKDGKIQAIIGFPGPEDMWQVADTFARIFAGTDFQASQNDLPSWIITKDTVPSTTEFYPLVEDYQAQYKALWGIS
jgi:ribose transport system substrate-binding protein